MMRQTLDFTGFFGYSILSYVSAINKTKVEVTFSKEVDSVTSSNFTIEGATVNSATLSADKKKATLDVSGLVYDKTFTVTAKNVLVNGAAADFGSKEFKTPAVTDLWDLVVTPKSETLIADGADNTVLTSGANTSCGYHRLCKQKEIATLHRPK